MTTQVNATPKNPSIEDTSFCTPNTGESSQPTIGGEGEGGEEGDIMDEDVTNDEMEAEDKDLLEEDLRQYHKVDSVNTIASLRMKPDHLFRLQIPLCRMVSMPMVRPTLSCDLDFLEHEFSKGYRDGAAVFYVTTTDEAGESSHFSEEDIEKWGPLWKEKNDAFNDYVGSIPELKFLINLRFYVCDGNHRLLSWMKYIDNKHSNDKDWHYAVDSIVLDTKGKTELVMHVMHDVNK